MAKINRKNTSVTAQPLTHGKSHWVCNSIKLRLRLHTVRLYPHLHVSNM